MLTALDESLLHQGPVTFDQTTVSDHRFFDRMWLGGHCAENIRFLMGLAVYKNTNTVDGYFTVLKDGKQYNLRVSRPLLPNPGELKAGPLSLHIVRPLEEIRLVVEPGPDHPFSADLTFTGTIPVRLEAPHQSRVDGRIAQDYVRFDQHGHINGWFEIDKQRTVADGWFGARDHSWGVRPSMGGYEPQTAFVGENDFRGEISAGADGWLAIYLFFETASYAGYIQHREDGAGRLIYHDGVFRKPGPLGGIVERTIVTLTHDLSFAEGTRSCSGGRLTAVLDDGDVVEIDFTTLLPGTCYKGTGYDSGYDDERGLGLHRGTLLETDVYDVSDVELVKLPDGRTIRPWHRELPSTLVIRGEGGLAYAAILNNGDIARYGLIGGFTNRRGA